jgi:hypothetical protein
MLEDHPAKRGLSGTTPKSQSVVIDLLAATLPKAYFLLQPTHCASSLVRDKLQIRPRRIKNDLVF